LLEEWGELILWVRRCAATKSGFLNFTFDNPSRP